MRYLRKNMKQYFQALILLLALFMQTVSAQSVANPKVTYFHNDITGTAVAATDEQGKVIWREQRRAYGEIKVDPLKPKSLDEFSVGYTGHQADKESGLTYAKARYYNKAIGRFYAPDPIPFRENDLVSINRYAYAANNPYMFFDPWGMESKFSQDVENRRKIEEELGIDSGYRRLENQGGANKLAKENIQEITTEIAVHVVPVEGAAVGILGTIGKWLGFTKKASKPAEVVTKLRETLYEPTGAMVGKKIGHTFKKHGSHNTEELLKESINAGRYNGQWLNDKAAEAFIAENLKHLKNGARDFIAPKGIGRVIHPDGTFSDAQYIRLVPSKSGVSTGYPLHKNEVNFKTLVK